MMQLLYRLSEFVQGLSSGMSEAGMFTSPLAAAYWAYHLTRTSFMTVQGLSGDNVCLSLGHAACLVISNIVLLRLDRPLHLILTCCDTCFAVRLQSFIP